MLIVHSQMRMFVLVGISAQKTDPIRFFVATDTRFDLIFYVYRQNDKIVRNPFDLNMN